MEFVKYAKEKGVAVGQLYSHLSVEERNAIEKMGAEGLSSRAIAKAIGRNPSTVTREIRRGVWSASQMNTSYKPYRDPRLRSPSTIPDPVYVGVWAHHRSERRKKRSHQPWRMRHDRLVGYVCDKLRAGWSPQLISGRLIRDFPHDPRMRVCPETLYAWIHHPARRDDHWMDYLARARTRRRRRHGRATVRCAPTGRTMIDARPEPINTRTEFGHWEADSVVSPKTSGGGIRTEVERVSRFLMARHVSALSSEDALTAQLDMFTPLPPAARLSTTCDNGSEHARHADLKAIVGMDVYFAHPYHSWERGTNERANGMIRRYFPKRTDFTQITPTELQTCVDEINNRPMACLNYQTPAEVFNHNLHLIP